MIIFFTVINFLVYFVIVQAFEGEYPKMLRLYLETWSKLRLSAVQVNTTGILPSPYPLPSLFPDPLHLPTFLYI